MGAELKGSTAGVANLASAELRCPVAPPPKFRLDFSGAFFTTALTARLDPERLRSRREALAERDESRVRIEAEFFDELDPWLVDRARRGVV